MQITGHLFDRGLAHPVRRPAGHVDMAGHGAHVHHAAPPCPQLRVQGPGQSEGGLQVGRKYVPDLAVGVGGGGLADVRARVVHEDVQAAAGPHGLDQHRAALGRRDVGAKARRGAPEARRRRPGRIGVPGADHDLGAEPGQRLGDGQPDPPGRPGHDGASPVEPPGRFVRHPSLPLLRKRWLVRPLRP